MFNCFDFFHYSLNDTAWIEICDACSSFLSRRMLERLRGQMNPELLISALEQQNAIYVKSPYQSREIYVEDSNITGSFGFLTIEQYKLTYCICSIFTWIFEELIPINSFPVIAIRQNKWHICHDLQSQKNGIETNEKFLWRCNKKLENRRVRKIVFIILWKTY